MAPKEILDRTFSDNKLSTMRQEQWAKLSTLLTYWQTLMTTLFFQVLTPQKSDPLNSCYRQPLTKLIMVIKPEHQQCTYGFCTTFLLISRWGRWKPQDTDEIHIYKKNYSFFSSFITFLYLKLFKLFSDFFLVAIFVAYFHLVVL